MLDDVTLRPACAADLDAILDVHERAARTAYRNFFPSDAPFPREASRSEWGGLFVIQGATALLAEQHVGAIGFAMAGPARDADLPRGTGELYGLHVVPELWRRRLGTRLLGAVLTDLRSRGYRCGALWVIEANRPARAFYERLGWRSDGAHRIEYETLRVIRYRAGL